MGGTRRGDDGAETVGLDAHQFVGGDGLDLRHEQMRALLLDQGAQGLGVGHVDDMGAVGDLLGGGVGVAVHRDGLHAQPLKLDDHFLAQLAGAQQHHPDGGRRQRGAEDHAPSP